ncbi:MAG: riboflavin synthase [Spirochaetota bacterium]|nr:riboflavin synthase [Spirochaetota bacterium]
MFTGIVEEIGDVKAIDRTGSGLNLSIKCKKILEDTQIGDSISIDGACQTVTSLNNDCFTAFASKITCDLTTLGNFKIGRRVNLERALTPTSRLGGHIVQGHVDGKGRVKSITRDENGISFEITATDEIIRYIVEKGSVAIDGISLTVVSLRDNAFMIYIIPETIRKTSLNERNVGDEVNVEVDILAKYAEKMIVRDEDNEKSLRDKLIKGGFI